MLSLFRLLKLCLLRRSLEVAINEYQLGMFERIVSDISDASLFVRAPGHGHPPVWILGHLAICAELGQKHLGGELRHSDWVPLFATGSSDDIAVDDSLSVSVLSQAVLDGYRGLQRLAIDAPAELLAKQNGVAALAGTPIFTVADAIGTLLTNHFGFHLAQLSACRREAGFEHLH